MLRQTSKIGRKNEIWNNGELRYSAEERIVYCAKEQFIRYSRGTIQPLMTSWETISVPRMSNLFDIVSYEDAIFVISCYDANKGVYSKEGNTNLTLDFENFKNESITIVKVQSPNMAALIWAVHDTESNLTIMFGGQFGQSFTKLGFRQKQTNPGHHASISLTRPGNLLVCCSRDNMLTEYTRNGNFVRKISFHPCHCSKQVLRAFHLKDDLFLIQHEGALHLLDSYEFSSASMATIMLVWIARV